MLATDNVVPAEQFLKFLRSPEAAAVLREAGLEP
jgi:ABC-type molybdate transport system substrate-binding protein